MNNPLGHTLSGHENLSLKGKNLQIGDSGKGNWVLMLGLLAVGMMVFVLATTPQWVGYDVNYTTVEEIVYNHNFSANITGFNNDISFGIDTNEDISWTNASGTYNVSIGVISAWILMTDSSTGNFTINATCDNQTGLFVIPIQATNNTETTLSAGAPFTFIINATNDAPEFKLDGIGDSYTFDSTGDTQIIFLNATDEEDHFPLSFNVTFNSTNCTHGANTGYTNNESCNLFDFGLTLDDIVNESAVISFAPNSSHVGTYWANVSVMDAAVLHDCPHDYCDATYNTTNLTTYYSKMVMFTVAGVLEVDISNCTNATLMEDEQFNCIIVITTPGANDDLTLTSVATFRAGGDSGNYNESLFYPGGSVSASNFNYNVSISFTPTKVDVANLTINFTADNGVASPVSEQIWIYVNFTESNVVLDAINDLNGSSALYENYTFQVNATDEDLLILDNTVKSEILTFDSNTSWVSVTKLGHSSGADYITANISVDYNYILANSSTGNYTILINVTDTASPTNNTDNYTFVIEILDDIAPEWNDTLRSPMNFSLIEGTSFTYNVSMNVSDSDINDTITFYYKNDSAEFCSLNSSTFNSTSGMISFIPTDCDVGYHDVTITAGDGKLNSSHEFNFTVSNIDDNPLIEALSANNGTPQTISEKFNLKVAESNEVTFELVIDDDDFLIPMGQKSFYNESLTINVTATNSNDSEKDLFEFSFVESENPHSQSISYNATFTPNGTQADNYTILINITDNSSNSVTRTFFLNISEIQNDPILTTFENQSLTIYDYLNFTVNATDDEDDEDANLNFSYSIANLSVGSPNLTIGNKSGIVEFDMNSNNSYSGVWNYSVTVTDSDSQTDSQIFYLYVYGDLTLTGPTTGDVFNLTENSASILNFTISHSVANNLTYELWVDSISCSYQNSSNCTYGNLTLRETANSFGDGSAYNWTFTPNYTDESYGNYKNLTVSVYSNNTELSFAQRISIMTNFSFKLNISHINMPIIFNATSCTSIPNKEVAWTGSADYDLSNCFFDADTSDNYYLQEVNFSVKSQASSSEVYADGNIIPANVSYNSWQLNFTTYRTSEFSEIIILSASDIDSVTNETINTAESVNNFTITFVAPETEVVVTPSPSTGGGGGGSTKLKHFSLKLVVPQDIIISDKNFIDIPFTIQNNGQMDLKGINLSSFVKFNDMFTDDVSISLGDNYIDQLKFGMSEDFTMRIIANTQRSGKYKATILADVTSPKFSDWGDFIIEIKKANESEAEQILIFTEKILSDNPECLELTEVLRRAEAAFILGEYSNAMSLGREAIEACEDAIETNEQIRYKMEGAVRDNFYYILFATLTVFFMGFVFYVYKRVRFNKYKADEYI